MKLATVGALVLGAFLTAGCAGGSKCVEGATDGDSLFEAVSTFMIDDGWYPEKIPDQTIVKATYQGETAAWLVFAQTREDARQVIIYSVLVSNVVEERRQAAAEYLTMANYGLWVGNFELDMNDGEVRLKTSIDCEGSVLSNAQIKNLMYINVALMDRYLPGLNQVVYEGVDPKAAIATVEG